VRGRGAARMPVPCGNHSRRCADGALWVSILTCRVLDLKPSCIHDRCPIILGSERDVRHVLSFYGASEESKA
jgi:hypothetical protein